MMSADGTKNEANAKSEKSVSSDISTDEENSNENIAVDDSNGTKTVFQLWTLLSNTGFPVFLSIGNGEYRAGRHQEGGVVPGKQQPEDEQRCGKAEGAHRGSRGSRGLPSNRGHY